MRATVVEYTVEPVTQERHAADELTGAPRLRASAWTEADKIRRQRQLRRKTTLARRALAANRGR